MVLKQKGMVLMKFNCGIILESLRWYNKIISLFEDNESYECREISGYYEDQRIIKLSYSNTHDIFIITGSGPSDAASNSEFLRNFNLNTLIRIGTTGALVEDIAVGDIVNAILAIKGDGVSNYYLPNDIPAIADISLFNSIGGFLRTKMKVIDGMVCSIAARYKQSKELLDSMVKYNVISVEMETAAIFAVGLDRKLPTVSLSIVCDTPINEYNEHDESTGVMDKNSINLVEAKFEELFYEVINWVIHLQYANGKITCGSFCSNC